MPAASAARTELRAELPMLFSDRKCPTMFKPGRTSFLTAGPGATAFPRKSTTNSPSTEIDTMRSLRC